MIVEIATALNLLKASSDQLSVLRKIKFDAAVTDKIIESQSAVLSAQAAMIEVNAKYQELLNEKNELNQQLIEMRNWETEAAKYELSEISPHIFAYVLKANVQSTAPAHWLCQNCYEGKHKSVLQRTMDIGIGVAYLCPRCRSTLIVS